MDLNARQAEIHQIVSEEMDARWAEADRHGHRWVPDLVTEFEINGRLYRHVGGAVCTCGWQPRRPHGAHARVSVGVHISRKTRHAEKIARENVQRRMEETRLAR